ncbi:MAG: transferrin-binding protein-like solute binding protein [Rhodobacteraceae bacterium]|nr:transferrin-binding protein-like solute binding protein [Paracoccaceae bacterium]
MMRHGPACALVLLSLAACSEPLEPGAMRAAAHAVVANAAPDARASTLTYSGQGNSGGVLTSNGLPTASGVEATMAYATDQRATGGAEVAFHNEPLTGVAVKCSRMGGGASVPECHAVNANEAYLVHEIHGHYAYAGSFSVQGIHGRAGEDAFVMVHAPTREDASALPEGTADYQGRFQAGIEATRDGRRHAGRITGNMSMTADFDSATVSGTMNGWVPGMDAADDAPFEAGFRDARIAPDGSFFSTNATRFDFDGDRAWGELDGGFYGPDGREVAGAYSFGNDSGGLTGVLAGCATDLHMTNCLQPVPRF